MSPPAIVEILSHQEISLSLAFVPIRCLVAVTRGPRPKRASQLARFPGPRPFLGSHQLASVQENWTQSSTPARVLADSSCASVSLPYGATTVILQLSGGHR